MTAKPQESILRRKDRSRAWCWARDVAADGSIWRMEVFKTCLARAERIPGSMDAPDQRHRHRWRDRLFFFVGVLSGAVALAIWLLYRRGSSRLPPGTVRIVAVHGEVSTRTRHVLAALNLADPPIAAIILLGRSRNHSRVVERLWSKQGFGPLPPLVVPYSRAAVFAALADFPNLWRDGWRTAARGPGHPSVIEWTAAGFRAWYGAVMMRWWTLQAVRPGCEVIFGITGTADTALLERAIQTGGGHTVHAVHGQLVGPNLLGFSDLALFRSQHDAMAMSRCNSYGRATIQATLQAKPTRGARGLLLLTNLAHPMNPRFKRAGISDELAVLTVAAEVARRLGPEAEPMLWKPHPVIASLPDDQAAALRRCAADLGWRELHADTAAYSELAAKWVVATPSTVALDLLQDGILSVIVDFNGTLLDTALSEMPVSECTTEDLLRVLQSLDDPAVYSTIYARTWAAIGPAAPLDLTQPLF
ncbi:MAG: hypothetical protein ACK4RZ_04540 [Paracoccaceae bacterium]